MMRTRGGKRMENTRIRKEQTTTAGGRGKRDFPVMRSWKRMPERTHWQTLLSEESGMGTVEVVLIIVVLIGLVIIFKKQLRALVNNVFDQITEDSNTVMG